MAQHEDTSRSSQTDRQEVVERPEDKDLQDHTFGISAAEKEAEAEAGAGADRRSESREREPHAGGKG